MLLYVIIVLNFILSIIFVSGQEIVGDICKLKQTNEEGKCVLLVDCLQAAQNLTRNQQIPQRCGFEGIIPIVCCSKNSIIPTSASSATPTGELTLNATRIVGVISQQKCREYSKFVFVRVKPILLDQNVEATIVDRCEYETVPLIVGGNAARKGEFPHMALIGYEPTPGDIQWQCGGSLISEQYLLAAAHCKSSRGLGEAKYARLGFIDHTDSSHLQQHKIIKQISHPDFKSPALYNDIGLFKLEKPVQINIYVRPACLFREDSAPIIDKAIATNWGNLQFDNNNQFRLFKNMMKLVETEKCSKFFLDRDGRRLPNGIKNDSQSCTESLNPSRKDDCQINSGGPLQIYHNRTDAYCMYDILGVASFGRTCNRGDSPDVFTRVSHYLKWIEDTVWP